MDKIINDFIEIRDFLLDSIDDKLDFYLKDLWDPISSHILIDHFYKVVEKDLHNIFPFFPKEFLPKIKLRLNYDDQTIEKSTQRFLNKEKYFIFLANVDIEQENYDLYYKTSFDPRKPYVFFARYGHKNSSILKGSKSAAAEYFMGKHTPLSIAYHIAHEDGVL